MGTVVVTGASTGIGRATVARLAGKGHTVFAGVRRQADADSLTRELGGNVVPLLVDVTEADQVAAAASTVATHVGDAGLDGLVNNAGAVVGGPLEHLPLDELRRQLEINVVAHVGVTQALLPLLRRARGRIVFTGSISGRIGLPLIGAYAASKHALEGLTESWRAELAPWGVHVALVEPGSISTPLWEKSRDQVEELAGSVPPEAREQYAEHLAMVNTVVDRQIKVAIPPERVARVMEKALFDRFPRSRYLVGPDAIGAGMASRLLPDRAKALVVGVASGARLPRRSDTSATGT